MLFSDIEGSTALLARLGERYALALGLQRSVLRSVWDRCAGVEMGTEGDSFFVVFARASDAVRAAVEAQRALASTSWPDGIAVRVRMGLHTGEPAPHEDGFVGIDVHRAARLSSIAHGGQIVISDATFQLVADRLSPSWFMSDLGWHHLKDFDDPVHVHQVTPDGLPASFPPLRSGWSPSNLPVERTALIGRQPEIDELQAIFASGEVRLLTLTGPGGSGKSRLATALAAARGTHLQAGAWFVPLSTVNRGEDIWPVLIDALVPSDESRTLTALASMLAGREALLVLDNLEQISDAAAVVDELMNLGQRLEIVATSRTPLHVHGEHLYPVSPLDLPTTDDARAAMGSAAVTLFCESAKLVKPDFALTPENTADVVAICERLDALPLALELAAARMRHLSPAVLLDRIHSSVDLHDIVQGRPQRHQALRETIDWSYQLLTADLRRTFRALSIFAGGACLDAVQEVCCPPAVDALEAVSELADASLVVITETSVDQLRCGLLQTIADFGLEGLEVDDEIDDVRRRHAEYFLSAAHSMQSELSTGRDHTARERFLTELGNYRSALTWALRPGEPAPPAERATLGVRLCAALRRPWTFYVYAPEAIKWLERAIDVSPDDAPSERAIVLRALAEVIEAQGAEKRMRLLLDEALQISRRLGEEAEVCETLCLLAGVDIAEGHLDDAMARVGEAFTAARALGDDEALQISLGTKGAVEAARKNHAASIAAWQECHDIALGHGMTRRAVGSQMSIADQLAASGQVVAGWRMLYELIPRVAQMSDHGININLLATWAHVFARLGDGPRAARMLGANSTYWTRAGLIAVPEAEAAAYEEWGINQVLTSMSPRDWDEQYRVGEGFTIQDALADAASAGVPPAG